MYLYTPLITAGSASYPQIRSVVTNTTAPVQFETTSTAHLSVLIYLATRPDEDDDGLAGVREPVRR